MAGGNTIALSATLALTAALSICCDNDPAPNERQHRPSATTAAAVAQPESDCVAPLEYEDGEYHMAIGAHIEAGSVGPVMGNGSFNGCDEGISAGASRGTRPVRKLDGVPTEQALVVTDSAGGSPALYVNSAIDDGVRAAALTELLEGQDPDQ